MVDRPAPGASADAVSADLIAHRAFTVSRKGFDQEEVKEFLQLAAGAVRGLHQRVEGLEASLADAEHRIANPRLDEDTLLRMVGEETGSILRSARAAARDMSATAERESTALRESAERESADLLERSISDVAQVRATAEAESAALRESAERETSEQRALAVLETSELRETTARELAELRASVEGETAALTELAERESTEMRARAEAEAARVVDEARQQAGDLRGEAETVLARATEEADQAVARIHTAAQESASQVLERARREADGLRQQAEHDRKLTVEGAQAVREKILGDLARRRRVASTQIEQLRAGRERLLESYGVVRRTLEEVNDELHRADAEAREAAAAAGRAYEEAADDEIAAPDLLATPSAPPVEVEPSVGQVETAASGGEIGDTSEPSPVSDSSPGADSSAVSEPEVAVDESASDDPPVLEAAVAEELARVEGGEPAVEATAATEVAAGPAPEAMSEATAVEGGATPEAEPTAAPLPPLESAAVAKDAAVPASQPDPEPAGSAQEAAPAAPAAKAKRARRTTTRPPAAVDDLFARIKAGRDDAVAHAKEVLHEPTAEAAAAEDSGPPAAAGDAAPAPTAVLVEAAVVEAPTAAVAPSDGEPQPGGGSDHDLEPRRSDEEEGWLQRRDEALGQTETSLTRKLKRALQDEQNDLLDRLRSLRGHPTVDSLLPTADDQRARFARAASVLVEEGGEKGARFTVGVLSDSGSRVGPPARPARVDDLVEELAGEIVTPLRRRLEQTIAENGDDDQAVLVEALGGAYREWKTQRIERIAGDALAAAFARGALNATPAGGTLRWVVDDLDGPCSDCDDNVLAGALPRHEAFPTGQHHPPAHAGCRCILVPVLVPEGAGTDLPVG